MQEPRKSYMVPALIGAIVAFAPFFRTFLSGQSFYFRDLSGQFLPGRRFLLDGLLRGEWRAWNPLLHEGAPVGLLPHTNLPELLQLLIPTEFGISLFLALHVSIAAVTFVYLARELSLSAVGAVAGALVYALGGFTLSTINLYVYVQTIAWAPLFVLAFRRAVGGGGRREVTLAAACLALLVGTTGLEIALQTCLLSVVLTPPSTMERFMKSASVALLGLMLAAASILPILGLAGETERGTGFPTSVVLANSNHPMAFFQVVVAGFFGDISNLSGTWWGVNFFPRGFPYILSLYLGPAVLVLGTAGAMSRHPLRTRLVLLAVLGAAASLGRYAGWDLLFDLSAALRFLRYPVKAFFTVQFSVALLAAIAISEIGSGANRMMKRVGLLALAAGSILVLMPWVPTLAPNATQWFLGGFLPPEVSAEKHALVARLMTADAATGGLVALVVGALALLACRERLLPQKAAIALVAVMGSDLIRAGAGLNSSVTQAFYSLSPEMTGEVDRLRRSEGRTFSCDPEGSRGYWQGRRARGAAHEAFTMATLQETLSPDFNVAFGVRTALSIDRTGLVPVNRVLTPELATCAEFARIVEPLQNAGVDRVLSIDPIADPHLRLLSEVSPQRIAPVTIHIYELTGSQPRFNLPVKIFRDIPNQMDLEVIAESETSLTVGDPFARGWTALVDGVERPIFRTESGHRGIRVHAGRNRIEMRYEAPGLRDGLSVTFLALMLAASLIWSDRRPAGSRRKQGDDRGLLKMPVGPIDGGRAKSSHE